ncbi:hypothetical protein ACOME3_001853 [Neoechinorhynchus agilis]
MTPLFPDAFWGVANTLAVALWIISGISMGQIRQHLKDRWRIVIYVCASCHVVGFVLFVLFASGNEIHLKNERIDQEHPHPQSNTDEHSV